VSEVIGYAGRARVVRTLAPSVDLVPRLLLDQIASGLVMAVAVYGARLVVPLRRWPAVAALVGLGAVVYGVTLVAISYDFRATVVAVAEDAGLY
jgi:hypothetical protein